MEVRERKRLSSQESESVAKGFRQYIDSKRKTHQLEANEAQKSLEKAHQSIRDSRATDSSSHTEFHRIIHNVREIRQSKEQSSMPWKIRFIDHLQAAIERNPETLFSKSIENDFQRSSIYCKLLSDIDSGNTERTSESYRKFATAHGLHRKTITDWAEGKKKPRLVNRLEKQELRTCYELLQGSIINVRIESMKDVDKLIEKHEIQCDGSSYHRCKTFFDVKNDWSMTEKQLSQLHGIPPTAIGRYRAGIDEPRTIAKLRKLEEDDILGKWIESGEWHIHKDKFKPLETPLQDKILSKSTKGEVNPFLFKAYENHYYYFNKADVPFQIMKQASLDFGYKEDPIRGCFHVRQVLDELYQGKSMDYMKGQRIRIDGRAMHHLCDLAGITFEELEGKVERITGANGHGGIFNPKFLTKEEMEVTLAGAVGAIVSDSHVPEKGCIAYYEANPERIGLFRGLLSRFGEIQWDEPSKKVNGTYEQWIPTPISDIVRGFGIPSGDRTILNYGLPAESKNWSDSAKCEYLKQMLAQESWVGKDSRLMWTRSCALDAGEKTDTYNFESLISARALKFLRESEEMKQTKKQDGYEKIKERYITFGRLRDIARLSNDEAAQELLDISERYRNKLIDDEVEMVRSFGASVSLKPQRISYHENSGRVSVSWGASISDEKSIKIIAKKFPPAHPEKAKRLLNPREESDIETHT